MLFQGADGTSHVLSYWICELKDTLGFEMVDFEGVAGTVKHDPFERHRGNALKAFLDYFSPKKIVSILADDINREDRMMRSVIEIIENDKSLDDQEKKEMGVNQTWITPKAVEHILIQMRILVKNGPSLMSKDDYHFSGLLSRILGSK